MTHPPFHWLRLPALLLVALAATSCFFDPTAGWIACGELEPEPGGRRRGPTSLAVSQASGDVLLVHNYSVLEIEPDTGTVTELVAQQPHLAVLSAAYAPDGQGVVYSASDFPRGPCPSALYLFDRGSGETTQLTDGAVSDDIPATIYQDEHVWFLRAGRLRDPMPDVGWYWTDWSVAKMSLETLEVEMLAFGESRRLHDLAVAAAGRVIAVKGDVPWPSPGFGYADVLLASHSPEYRGLYERMEEEIPVDLFARCRYSSRHPALSYDGESIAVIGFHGPMEGCDPSVTRWGVAVGDVGGGPLRVVYRDQGVGSPGQPGRVAWSRSKDFLYLTTIGHTESEFIREDAYRLWRVDLDSGALDLVATLPESPAG